MLLLRVIMRERTTQLLARLFDLVVVDDMLCLLRCLLEMRVVVFSM